MTSKRTLTPAEQRHLTPEQRNYLLSNPCISCLQPQMLASEALYQTRHGAVTIARAMELDKVQARMADVLKGRAFAMATTCFDGYTAAEDAFIDRHGISSALS